MIMEEHDDLALLPPRFTSPARLLLRFMDAKDSGQEAISDPEGGNQISRFVAIDAEPSGWRTRIL
jgi:hypothetical protein